MACPMPAAKPWPRQPMAHAVRPATVLAATRSRRGRHKALMPPMRWPVLGLAVHFHRQQPAVAVQGLGSWRVTHGRRPVAACPTLRAKLWQKQPMVHGDRPGTIPAVRICRMPEQLPAPINPARWLAVVNGVDFPRPSMGVGRAAMAFPPMAPARWWDRAWLAPATRLWPRLPRVILDPLASVHLVPRAAVAGCAEIIPAPPQTGPGHAVLFRQMHLRRLPDEPVPANPAVRPAGRAWPRPAMCLRPA